MMRWEEKAEEMYIENREFVKPTLEELKKIASKQGITLKQLIETEIALSQFRSETNKTCIVRYINGFMGAGTLNIPIYHKGIANTVRLAIRFCSKYEDFIAVDIDISLTLKEIKNLSETLIGCIKKSTWEKTWLGKEIKKLEEDDEIVDEDEDDDSLW